MGVLDRFEKGIERAVNGAFAKAFRSEVQPVEIASALRRECDEKASIVGRDRTIAPNMFVVELGAADHERLGEWEAALGDELGAAVHEHARQQSYAFVGPVQVQFAQTDDLDTGVFRVSSHTARPHEMGGYGQDQQGQPARGQEGYPAQGRYAQQDPYAQDPYAQGRHGADPYAQGHYGQEQYAPQHHPQEQYAPDPYARRDDSRGAHAGGAPVAPAYPGAAPAGYPGGGYGQEAQGGYAPSWTAAPTSLGSLDVDGSPHRIDRAVTVIGRAMDVDIVLDDPGVSRRHAEIHVVDGQARVIDLGSTNGTFVDGERIHAAALADGSTVTVGRTRITYRSGQW